MSIIRKVATAGVVATVGFGLCAASASATYSISGGAFTSTASSTYRLTVGGSYTYTCTSTVFTGTATGGDNVDVTPSIYGCRWLGFADHVTQSGPWNLQITGGGAGGYAGRVTIPAGTVTTITWPLAGCTVAIAGPQTFTHGAGGNVVSATNWASGTGVNLTVVFNNVTYTASGSCPWGTGTYSNGTYSSGGATSFPGIAITGP